MNTPTINQWPVRAFMPNVVSESLNVTNTPVFKMFKLKTAEEVFAGDISMSYADKEQLVGETMATLLLSHPDLFGTGHVGVHITDTVLDDAHNASLGLTDYKTRN